MTDRIRRLTRWLLVGVTLLVANSAYLVIDGNPHAFYFANLLFHFGFGLALLVAFLLWWWPRRGRVLITAGTLALLASSACAVALVPVGNFGSGRALLYAHIGLAVLGLVLLLAEGFRTWTGPAPRWAAAGLVAAIVVPTVVILINRNTPEPDATITNPPAVTTMAEEAMGGEDGPYFPSAVHNTHGGLVPSSIYMEPQTCGRSGCHPNLVDQWESSAHHLSSFNNQWYRKSIEYMQEVAGVVPSKWCGGCHDPAVLQSGMMDTPIEQIIDTPEAQAGITCTACHMITDVKSTMGQGDYEITVPALHDLATSDNRLLTGLHDLIVKLDPEPHRRTFIKPFFRNEFSPEYCSSCHKVHLDEPVNNYRWIRGFNEYDNWQASGVSGYGARSFYYPPEPQACIDCHMPRVASDDAGQKDGRIRSHRFAAANTGLPTVEGDETQLQEVIDFLQARQVTVDIFAMTEGREIEENEGGLAIEGPALSTSFAVGEEGGMAVGVGGAATGEVETVFAPLDRIPATVRRGESTRIDVVVRTRNVGHFFPGGTVDAYDCWLELRAVDSTGETIYWSGMADEDSPVSPDAHFYRSLMIDERGNPINKRNAFHTRAVVYVRLIPPGAADTAHFRLQIPESGGDEIELTAKLNYRKFSWFNTQFSFAGEPLEGEDAEFGPDFDDRTFVFTGDPSKTSGKLKQIPKLPIVVMASDTQILKVVDADAELPAMSGDHEKPELDRERWNDYGIGLLLQGDLRGAKAAFTRVTELEPDYVDGWVNLGRVALAEGDLEAAKSVLQVALDMQPNLARARFFYGLYLKEIGEYEAALEAFGVAADQYPRDRVVRNQLARVHFLDRDYENAIEQAEVVLTIDPEDLMAHYTLMLANRGVGDIDKSTHHQALYTRFKADESSQVLTGKYREEHPHDNRERQSIHEHPSVPPEEIQAFLERGTTDVPVAESVAAGG